jgi:hypothetical protein
MARPNDYPYWATLSETDPVFGTPNKATPSVEKQDYGQRANKNTLRQDINYLFNKIREWIQHFNEQYAVNDVYIVADTGQTEAQISAQLGGTWEFIDGATGSDTIAGQAVLVFKKISEVNV